MAANSAFEPVREKGWLLGFGNMLRKENRLWWGTRRWLWQALLWLVIMNGMVILMLFVLPSMVPDDGEPTGIPNGIETIFGMGVTFISLGAVILSQGMIVDEKTSGTGEWVLSKPLSRPAFLLAKLAGNGIGIIAVLVMLQSLVAYGLIWIQSGEAFPPVQYLLGVGLLSLHVLFYLTLTMLLGVFVQSRGIIIAVPLAILLSGGLLSGLVGDLVYITPWPISSLLPLLVAGEQLPQSALLPYIMLGVWSLVFVAAALWKFERTEF
jgi:ABC-2 type transport system permease protein